jgi:hypothetical protein
MHRDSLFLLMLAEAIGFGTICFLLKRLAQFRKRTWDDVPEFLRQLNGPEVGRLFDIEAERQAMACGNHRRCLRARLDLAREYLQRMCHNATIVYQWGETEWSDMLRHGLEYDQETRERLLALHREAITFLVAARLALVQMWFWSILHFDKWRMLPLPSVAALKKPASIDLLEAYERVKLAAGALALVYGEEHREEINALM